jgi:hypothetical protein
MAGALAIDFRAARQICCRGLIAQLTLLSRTTAIAILEAALKQMHVCALLPANNVNDLSLTTHQHNNANHLPFTSARAFFCWPHQPELHAAFLLLAACVLVVPAAGWCLAALPGALVLLACILGPTGVDLDLGLAHRSAL